MRLCPTVEGSASPLITHRIGVDVCLARQAANFHKCHRCQFRGKSAEWEPAPQLPVLEVTLGSPRRNGKAGKHHGPVEIPVAPAAMTRKAAAKAAQKAAKSQSKPGPKLEPAAAMAAAPRARGKGKKPAPSPVVVTGG